MEAGQPKNAASAGTLVPMVSAALVFSLLAGCGGGTGADDVPPPVMREAGAGAAAATPLAPAADGVAGADALAAAASAGAEAFGAGSASFATADTEALDPASLDTTQAFALAVGAVAGSSAGLALPAEQPSLSVTAVAPVVPAAAPAAPPPAPTVAATAVSASGDSLPLVWSSNFDNGLADWPTRTTGWGTTNRAFVASPEIKGKALSVFYPAGTIDPGTMKNAGLPYGGTGFRSKFSATGYDVARLSYKVRFPSDFAQALGGKLPGLCGGTCNSGGKMPTGFDGFSARYMWTGNFAASVYAYLPTSVTYGTSIGTRRIPLQRGAWVQLTQEVKLNTVGLADGYIKVWSDGVLVVDAQGLTFRYTDAVKITTVMFETFYGGNTVEWAAPKDTTVKFAEFSVSGR